MVVTNNSDFFVRRKDEALLVELVLVPVAKEPPLRKAQEPNWIIVLQFEFNQWYAAILAYLRDRLGNHFVSAA